jgi:D-alanyl-D-alanine carboxypeptidase/D-alanyl-D-alanine-endopeptidase (penicillin-binding protein 4)
MAAVALAWVLAYAPLSASRSPSAARVALNEVIGSLRSDLEAILRAAWRSSRWSVLAVSLDRGDTLFAENPHAALAPASNLKLITTATAIQWLGPAFRYQTYLLGSGPVRNGRLEGDLVLYGTGDPGISSRFQASANAVFEAFADSLLAAGIYGIAGDVVGDGSYFSGPLLADGWNPEDLNDSFAAPSASLSFNENVFQLRVRAHAGGTIPEILTIPEGAGVPVLNTAVVGAGRTLLIRRPGPLEPISIDGSMPVGGREVWRQMTVQDPAHYAASVLRTVLEAKGIRVFGGARSSYAADASPVTGRRLWAPALGQRLAPRVLAHHRSPPLLDYLVVVNKRSHNLLADQVLKTVGRVVEGEGSYAGGGRAVARFMTDSVGVSSAELAIHDGSGLSTLNRVSAADFVSLMSYMSRRGDWHTLWETLPEAGNPRELRRMYRSQAAGNLRAKTGTIENVSALSGMVHSANGERIAFSIIVNDAPSTNRAKGIEDRIGTRLAAFDRPVEVAPLVNVLAEAAGDSSAPGAAPPSTSAVNGEVGLPTEALADGSQSTPEGAAAPAAEEGSRQHQVQAGENFSVIARRYGVALDALVSANPELPPRRLQPGMWVRIP